MRFLLFYVGSISAFGGFHHAIVRPLDQCRLLSGKRRKFITSQFCSSDNLIVLPPPPDFNVINRVTPADIINGTTQGSIITHFYRMPISGFTSSALPNLFSIEDRTRLRLESQNVTLPVALMLLDPEKYPTQSRARKVIRQKSICISRRCSNYSNNETLEFNELGKVIARIYPGDVIGFQRRAGSDYSAIEGVPYRQPPFEVSVVFEDEHMAIVNKPAGVVVYRAEGGRGGGARAGGQGRDTLLSALSHVLMPSNFTSDDDDENVPLKRPQPVHRLDRPTSGLMVIAKTKAAATYLAQQFEYRKAKKSYVAIVNGSPTFNSDSKEGSSDWNTIDYDLEEKSAITQWRTIEKVRSLRGTEGHITLLELKPKTGRYHQLRRHMAWVCKTPIIGDTTYVDTDISEPSDQVIDNDDVPPTYFRHRGLFLCSNQIEIAHPYYNTPAGRKQWIDMDRRIQIHGEAIIWEDEAGLVMIKATIDIPDKFRTFMERENTRAIKFMDDCSLV